ncbi:MAG: helix-turn-helix domain-containing protein [Paludibacteraceae bacterium]|nr:helix-turn-helix domain-containing protein [Paludibacteraceae bacterium]
MVCKNRFFVVSLHPKSVIMRESFTEITRLEPLDIFYVGDRHKTYFEYPAHCHEVYELNFVENAAGVERTIGDSRETIGNLDLVLITGSKLVHVWEQGTCPEQDIHEITIHIDPDTFHGTLMDKRAFASIRRMLERAQRGLAFPEPAIQILREDIINLAQSNDSFASVIRLFNLLYRLSLVENARELSSSSFVNAREENEDERVRQVKEYIAQNYTRDIALQELADIACMAPESFSRFFRNKTGRTPNRYIIDYRLGIAARMLLTTQLAVSEIGFSCGFNTLSHFNRLFRESKGCTPSEFRERF